ncbi:MAG: 3-methyl-2-oxobutanoate hydroxymethyltransferase [Proteobacteria bacterium]|nr:3-methyl-2-oxobutanoate hydroxymethyltransferase [Pseudomonadota bacterium]
MSRLNLTSLRQMKQENDKIVMLTAYDASFSQVLDSAGVDIILVGDSLGTVVQGHESTVPVTVDDMIYHCRHVLRGSQRALVVIDMPFMSYATPQQAAQNAARLMTSGGAQMVKLEGGGAVIEETVRELTERGIPVCGHLGLLPQSEHRLSGYQSQKWSKEAVNKLLEDAKGLQQAGAEMVVLACVPATVGAQITQELTIPVIGFGAGRACDGQVLILYDMLGISSGEMLKFNHNFLADSDSIPNAVEKYVQDVKNGDFPQPRHEYE